MFTIVLSLIILAAVLLVVIVLAQNSKGGGLTSQFGGSGASNMIGVKKTGDLLEKLTWGLITAIFIMTLGTKFLMDDNNGQRTDEYTKRAQESTTAAPALDLGGAEESAQPIDVEPAGDGSLDELNTDESSEGNN